jgi:hypothetical protein
VGVDPLVLIVNIDEQVRVQAEEEKTPVAPEGRLEKENDTDCALPDAKVALTVLFPEDPALSERVPELESVKSKGFVTGALCW